MLCRALDTPVALGDAEPVATEADQPRPGVAGNDGERSSVGIGPQTS